MHNRLRAHNKQEYQFCLVVNGYNFTVSDSIRLLPPFSRESTFKRKNLLLFGILFSLQCLKLVLRENKNKTKRKHVTRLKSLKVFTEAATMTPVNLPCQSRCPSLSCPLDVCVCVCEGGWGGGNTVDIPPPHKPGGNIYTSLEGTYMSSLSCLPVFFFFKNQAVAVAHKQ